MLAMRTAAAFLWLPPTDMEFKLIQDLPATILVGRPIDPPIQARCPAEPGASSARLSVETIDGKEDSELGLLCGLRNVTPRQDGNDLNFKFCSILCGWSRFTADAEGRRVRLRVTLFRGEDAVATGLTEPILVRKSDFDYQQAWVRTMEEKRLEEEERNIEY